MLQICSGEECARRAGLERLCVCTRVDLIDNWAVGMLLLISRPGNFWIRLVFWLDTGKQEEKAIYQIPNFWRECSWDKSGIPNKT